jgi:hypothetical protein
MMNCEMMQCSLHERNPFPISTALDPVAFEMKVDFPAPVTPITAIRYSSVSPSLVVCLMNCSVSYAAILNLREERAGIEFWV